MGIKVFWLMADYNQEVVDGGKITSIVLYKPQKNDNDAGNDNELPVPPPIFGRGLGLFCYYFFYIYM
jgi:hypothetical protein